MQKNRVASKPSLALSIILPMMNAVSDMEDVFRAIADQTDIDKSRIEIIFVDDGSKDDTLQKAGELKSILKDYKDFRIIKHKTRKGLSATRHDGAKAARGKYITFIDKKVRPDHDYLFNFLNKNKNIIIGNVYIDKHRSLWGRFLTIIRKKIYYPYFNNDFEDIELDHAAYRKFKNKGGGSAMLVLRDYYLRIAKDQKMGANVNDDSAFIESLTKLEPLLKTSSAKTEYQNREGFFENIAHLFNRGPKFIDYYMKPGSRFFPYIILLLLLVAMNIVLLLAAPELLLYELLLLATIVVLLSLWIAEDMGDFFISLFLMPIAALSFSAGILKGILLKLLGKY
jgi:glycosyltransferase involved in cell wall biosynthesis